MLLGRKAVINLESIWKSRDITFLTKVHIINAIVFPVVIYGCESCTGKKTECQRINAFEPWCWRTLLSPRDCKEIKSVNPKGNQSWIFIGRTDVEAEAPILWPSDAKNWLTRKYPDSGKDWRQEEKGMAEDKMVDDIINWMDMSLNKLWELMMSGKPGVLQSMGLQRVQRLSGWNELNWPLFLSVISTISQIAVPWQLKLSFIFLYDP